MDTAALAIQPAYYLIKKNENYEPAMTEGDYCPWVKFIVVQKKHYFTTRKKVAALARQP